MNIMTVRLEAGANGPRSPTFEVQITMESTIVGYEKSEEMIHVP